MNLRNFCEYLLDGPKEVLRGEWLRQEAISAYFFGKFDIVLGSGSAAAGQSNDSYLPLNGAQQRNRFHRFSLRHNQVYDNQVTRLLTISIASFISMANAPDVMAGTF